MYSYKNLYSIILSIFIILTFTSCVHNINSKGLTLSVTDSELTQSFNDSFPIKKDFIFGSIQVENPKIDIFKDSQRVTSSINLNFSTLFTNTQKGNFTISGEPYFNKEESSIHLQDVRIERFEFAKLRLGKKFDETFLKTLSPMVDRLFQKIPIYKIPKDSFNGNFIKDIKIGDSKLLITYGI